MPGLPPKAEVVVQEAFKRDPHGGGPDWVKPLSEKINSQRGGRLQGTSIRGNVCRGVASSPAR
jgi:hypothetical protein